MSKLVPKQVTITSVFKAYGFRDGLSSGSEISMTYEIPDGMPDLAKEIKMKKLVLDSLVLRAEWVRGSIPEEVYAHEAHKLDEAAAKLVKTDGTGTAPQTS